MNKKLKKIAAAGAACLLLLGLMAAPASAHGGRHHGGGSGRYAVCTLDGCTESGRHTHGGVTYCGHDGSGSCRAVHGHHGGYR